MPVRLRLALLAACGLRWLQTQVSRTQTAPIALTLFCPIWAPPRVQHAHGIAAFTVVGLPDGAVGALFKPARFRQHWTPSVQAECSVAWRLSKLGDEYLLIVRAEELQADCWIRLVMERAEGQAKAAWPQHGKAQHVRYVACAGA